MSTDRAAAYELRSEGVRRHRRGPPDVCSGRDGAGSVYIERLTKRLLFGLEAGSFVTSSVLTAAGPRLAEFVAPTGPDRERQWERIKVAEVDGRNCMVFSDEEEARRFWIGFSFELPSAAWGRAGDGGR
jgi:hypothetical protein